MDVPSEYRRAVALAIDGEVLEELIALAKDVRARIRAQVTAEFLPHTGLDKGGTWWPLLDRPRDGAPVQ